MVGGGSNAEDSTVPNFREAIENRGVDRISHILRKTPQSHPPSRRYALVEERDNRVSTSFLVDGPGSVPLGGYYSALLAGGHGGSTRYACGRDF